MTRQRDFIAYHKSIADELRATKDRIRNLIGDRHWQTDGEHKEAVLRKVLRNHIAESLHVGTGFVCGPDTTSHQIDVLISSRDKPTLFRDGELLLITPDAVAGIIEVKTRVPTDLNDVLMKLADDVAMIREDNPRCRAGLFIYESYPGNNRHERILRLLKEVTHGDEKRVVNWLAAGPNLFFRYWHDGNDVASPAHGPVWHSYALKDLAHAYFLSNAVWDTCPNIDLAMQFAWFPVEGGKERFRKYFISFNDAEVRSFEGGGRI